MSTPVINVVIPAYNAQRTLAETLDSVVAQTRQPDRIILVDDGSTDDTVALAQSYKDSGAPLTIISQENQGTAGAYNTGIATIKEGWIVMLSADDLILPEHLAVLERTISAKPHAHIISPNGYYLEKGKKTLANPLDAHPYKNDSCSLHDLIESCFFAVGTAFTKEAFDAVGGFELGFYAEDYLLFLSIFAAGYEHAYTGEATAVHRRTKEQKSNRALQMREEEIVDFKIIQERYDLDEATRVLIAQKVASLKKNIALRKKLYTVLSPERAEALIRFVMDR